MDEALTFLSTLVRIQSIFSLELIQSRCFQCSVPKELCRLTRWLLSGISKTLRVVPTYSIVLPQNLSSVPRHYSTQINRRGCTSMGYFRRALGDESYLPLPMHLNWNMRAAESVIFWDIWHSRMKCDLVVEAWRNDWGTYCPVPSQKSDDHGYQMVYIHLLIGYKVQIEGVGNPERRYNAKGMSGFLKIHSNVLTNYSFSCASILYIVSNM